MIIKLSKRILTLLLLTITFILLVAAGSYAKPMSPQSYAHQLVKDDKQYECLVRLWMAESNWRSNADNPTSTAFGIAQLLNEKSTDPYRQIRDGLRYVYARHGTPCQASRFHARKGWY
jgi:hypothetical protein